MAKLTATSTLILFFFAFSHARTLFDSLEISVADRDLSNSLPESDSNPTTILLPREKPESDPTTLVDLKPESVNDLPESDTITIDVVQLIQPSTLVSLRQINRHFGVKRQFPFRVPLRPYHHHIKPMNPRFHGREVPYGDDMILGASDQMKFRGGERQIPGGWDSFHHHHHYDDDGVRRFPMKPHMFAKEKFKRSFHHEEEEGGVLKRFRKFMYSHF